MFDVVIIGAGMAGMTTALYLRRAEKKVLLLEAESLGGQISSSPLVENYPGVAKISGLQLMNNLFEQVESLGAQMELEKVIAIENLPTKKIVVTEENRYETKAVVIATGVKHRFLNLAREDELIGKGVSYCAVCDGPFFKDKVVAVAGGGNAALQQAIYLTQFCARVYLIHRRAEFRAEATLVERVKKNKKVELILEKQIIELLGAEKLTGLHLKDLQDSGEEKLNVSGLFVAVGQVPNNDAFVPLGIVNEQGLIATNQNCETAVPGIFAAGDCRAKKVRQLTTAAADGTIVALALS